MPEEQAEGVPEPTVGRSSCLPAISNPPTDAFRKPSGFLNFTVSVHDNCFAARCQNFRSHRIPETRRGSRHRRSAATHSGGFGHGLALPADAGLPLAGRQGFSSGLLLLGCELFGGNPEDGLTSAVSLKLFHQFALVHNDIEDSSHTRRGQPALHRIHGIR
ncbi:MAG: hypothetical protein CL911_03460 [Deltaproteobacteria bacterium]|nr:hypothetical protein [Deltaproteobacteria bacterium]